MRNRTISEECRRWVMGKSNWTEKERGKWIRLTEKYVDPVAGERKMSRMDDAFRKETLDRMDRMRAAEESREMLVGMLRDVAAKAVKEKKT